MIKDICLDTKCGDQLKHVDPEKLKIREWVKTLRKRKQSRGCGFILKADELG